MKSQAQSLYFVRTRHEILVPKNRYNHIALVDAIQTLRTIFPGTPIRLVPHLTKFHFYAQASSPRFTLPVDH